MCVRARAQVLAEEIIPLDSGMHNPDGSTTIVGFRGQELTADEGSGTTGDLLTLPCDAALLQAAKTAAVRLDDSSGLPFWPGRDGPPAVHSGVVGSSDRWTQHRPSIEALHDKHSTLCEEMECQVRTHMGCCIHTESNIGWAASKASASFLVLR